MFLTTKTEQVAEMTKRCTPSQTDVIFVVMNALVHVLEHEVLLLLTAIEKATARYHVHSFDLDCSDRLVVANQNYHAYVSSSSSWHRIANQDAHAFDLRCSTRLMLANQNVHTSELSCSIQLVFANLNPHASRLSSILARQKMRMK